MLLKGKTAVITGCNRGIGLSILEIFSQNGAKVIACVRKSSDDFRNKIKKISDETGNDIEIVTFDLESESEIEQGFGQIRKITNSIDILVNNAGINQISLFQMITLKTFKSIFDINFFSIVNFTQKILKIIKKNNFSKIINISSNAAILSDAGRSAYASSKAALISFSKVLSKELGIYKINVNVVAPGIVKTDMMKNTSQKIIDEVIKNTPLNKAAEPSDIAKTVLFLASNNSNHITGETIFITGGF